MKFYSIVLSLFVILLLPFVAYNCNASYSFCSFKPAEDYFPNFDDPLWEMDESNSVQLLLANERLRISSLSIDGKNSLIIKAYFDEKEKKFIIQEGRKDRDRAVERSCIQVTCILEGGGRRVFTFSANGDSVWEFASLRNRVSRRKINACGDVLNMNYLLSLFMPTSKVRDFLLMRKYLAGNRSFSACPTRVLIRFGDDGEFEYHAREIAANPCSSLSYQVEEVFL